ncbi:ribonuclease M5 [Weissella hellenica]|uniref:Ribonuclease M5 n=2 Tax=Weissella hellenica TaxID=46256 RepID=A0ABY0K3D6_WEIHE|nr:ribonuclease M5 [Weissella hellenica]SCC08030.1 ribonuclease M5 [Weissella hellenica]
MMKIKEVIVVEGRADTEALRHAVNADTIETNGSALSEQTIAAIKQAAANRGVIVFTDPDFNGERLRKIISSVVPDAKHAFLTKDEAGRQIKHHSLGIEYATPVVLQTALQAVYTPKTTAITTDITMADLRRLGLVAGQDAAKRREYISEAMNLGYVNGKQLMNRLIMFGIKKQNLLTVLDELDEEKE